MTTTDETKDKKDETKDKKKGGLRVVRPADVKKPEKDDVGASSPLKAAAEALSGDVLTAADQESIEIRDRVRELLLGMETGYFELAENLHKVWNGLLYAKWGFKTWDEYVEKEVGFKRRKAQYLIQIHDWCKGKLLDDGNRKAIQGLGWTKASKLVGVVDDSNAREWATKGKEMTVLALDEAVKEELTRRATPEGDRGAEDDAGKNPRRTDGPPKRLTFTLFPAQYENIRVALALAAKMADSEKQGHLLDLMATSFLTMNVEGDVRHLIQHLERSLGVRFVGLDDRSQEIVFGNDVIDKMIAAAEGKTEGESDDGSSE